MNKFLRVAVAGSLSLVAGWASAVSVSNAGGTAYGSAATSPLSGGASVFGFSSTDGDGVFDVFGVALPVTRGFSAGVFYDQVSTVFGPAHVTTITFGPATSFTANLNIAPFGEDYGLDGLINNGNISAKPLTFAVYNGLAEVDRFVLHDIPATDFTVGVPFGFTYTAGGSFTGFKVLASSSDTETYALSGVSITPVPEPETYAMMLAGLGALGFMARRRRPQA